MDKERMTELERLIQSDYSNLAGIIVQQNGAKQYENYFNGYTAEDKVHIYSVTKSIISILIGIAIDRGIIKSVHQSIMEFYPDYTNEKNKKKLQNIAVRNLLTMTASIPNESENYEQYFTSSSWATYALDLLAEKGTVGQFQYAPLIIPDILSGILTRATGESVLEFARESLFTSLDISIGDSIFFHSKEEQMAWYQAKSPDGWVADPTGVNTAGWGLCLTPEDMIKIGQLYLNKGTWNGRQIVSQQWIEESTTEQSRWEQLNLSYGYLWWVQSEHGYEAMGESGNIIYVNTKKEIVIAITAAFSPEAKDIIEFIQEHVEPVLS